MWVGSCCLVESRVPETYVGDVIFIRSIEILALHIIPFCFLNKNDSSRSSKYLWTVLLIRNARCTVCWLSLWDCANLWMSIGHLLLSEPVCGLYSVPF